MKSRLLTAILSFALGLNTVLLVIAVVKLERLERRQDRRQEPEEARGAPSRGPREGDSMLAGLPRINPEQLGLSEDQSRAVRQLRQTWQKEEEVRRERAQTRRQQIPKVYESEQVRIEALMPLLDQAHEDAKERLQSLVKLYTAYQEILTPEQEAKFRELVRERSRPPMPASGVRTRLNRLRSLREGQAGGPEGGLPGEVFGQHPPMEGMPPHEGMEGGPPPEGGAPEGPPMEAPAQP